MTEALRADALDFRQCTRTEREEPHEPIEETPDTLGAFPRLSDWQIELLSTGGERRPTRPGDILFREGELDYDFVVVLEGLVAIVEDVAGAERTIAVHGPGRSAS